MSLGWDSGYQAWWLTEAILMTLVVFDHEMDRIFVSSVISEVLFYRHFLYIECYSSQ